MCAQIAQTYLCTHTQIEWQDKINKHECPGIGKKHSHTHTQSVWSNYLKLLVIQDVYRSNKRLPLQSLCCAGETETSFPPSVSARQRHREKSGTTSFRTLLGLKMFFGSYPMPWMRMRVEVHRHGSVRYKNLYRFGPAWLPLRPYMCVRWQLPCVARGRPSLHERGRGGGSSFCRSRPGSIAHAATSTSASLCGREKNRKKEARTPSSSPVLVVLFLRTGMLYLPTCITRCQHTLLSLAGALRSREEHTSLYLRVCVRCVCVCVCVCVCGTRVSRDEYIMVLLARRI